MRFLPTLEKQWNLFAERLFNDVLYKKSLISAHITHLFDSVSVFQIDKQKIEKIVNMLRKLSVASLDLHAIFKSFWMPK
jgi:hypothetical protein